ncbi:MAG: heparinase II/III family protein [Actinobacteria bacterium]|nr:heparinase II/III family protein [Actinomycetota bacterium]
MSEKLSGKLKLFILIVKTPLKSVYGFICSIKNFFGYRASLYNNKRFNNLKFLRKIAGDNRNLSNVINSANYEDLVYKITSSNFGKLNFMDINDKEFIQSNLSISEKEKIIKEADKVCNHEFDLLGSGRVKVDYDLKAEGFEGYVYENKLSFNEIDAIKNNLNFKINKTLNFTDDNFNLYEPIDWHIDFKSGYRWDNKIWYKKIKYGHLPGVDIKIPWELSRASHFVTLGQAYWLTSDEKYTKEFICQILDWIENNYAGFGVNWTCTMDVAIRACNWIIGFSFFRYSPLINKEFVSQLAKCLYLHGLHIKNNLEKGIFRIKNNHYVSDITGLLYIGLFFNFTVFGKKWLEFAIKELKKEINTQVYEDGTNFEASTFYHRLSIELFFYPVFFTVKNSPKFNGENFVNLGTEIFGSAYLAKIKKMFDVMLNLIDLNGHIPQIGDNDNGKLHLFSDSEIKNIKYLIAIKNIFFGNIQLNDPKVKEFEFNQSALWLSGKYGKEIWDKLSEISLKNLKSVSFNDSGWYLMKNNRKADNVFSDLMILCGPNGQKNKGGHSHNDKLSISLNINGSSIFTDPGAYIYTPINRLRDEFRSCSSHNTICIDGLEQNRFVTGNPFVMVDDAKARLNKIIENDNYYFFSGEHYGYTRLKDSVIHGRQLLFDKNNSSLLIKDMFKGSQAYHEYNCSFILAPDLKFSIGKDKTMIFNIPEEINFNFLPVSDLEINFEIAGAFYSDGYGEKGKTFKLTYTFNSEKPSEIYFVFAREGIKYDLETLKRIFKEFDQDE